MKLLILFLGNHHKSGDQWLVVPGIPEYVCVSI